MGDSKKGDSRIMDFFRFAEQELESALEMKPSINYGCCGKLLKDRFRECELEEMKEVLRFALSGADDFYNSTGYSLQAFLSPALFQKLRVAWRAQKKRAEQTETKGQKWKDYKELSREEYLKKYPEDLKYAN